MRGLEEFVTVSGRLETERAAAGPILDSVRSHLPLLPAAIPHSWRLMPVAQGLCALAEECLPESPQLGVALAKLAIEIADQLDDTYPRPFRELTSCAAWCALGSALRAAGSPFQALSAFQHAHAAVERSHGYGEDAAVIELGRAHALTDLHLFTEAVVSIHFARVVFTEYGDDRFHRRIEECDGLLRVIQSLRARRGLRLRKWSRFKQRLRSS